ncbi:MAG: zinc ribbon domain-containing protein [Lachnospiraceae bacterium]|nr:zinc ribbon domain-containing protein [Lachnospiraceae bacterium]
MSTNTQNIDWSKVKICQSCGMPLLEEEHFAKNADGTKNDKWCCYCFHDGELGECTLEEMIDICAPIEVRDGRCKTLEEAKEQLRQFLPTLERWKK